VSPPFRLDITEAFWYSPTLFSKKLVFPLHMVQGQHVKYIIFDLLLTTAKQ